MTQATEHKTHVEESLTAELPVGNPLMIGLPTFIAGGVALGLVLTGYVPATALGASIPIIMTATGLGQIITAIWAASLANNAVAAVAAIFGGFWLSYAALVLGLTHGWYGITKADTVATQELFLLTWLIVVVLLTLVSLRLPFAFTLLFLLVDVALLLAFISTVKTNTSLQKASGYVVFAFDLVGAYLFYDAFTSSTGGKSIPLGRALLQERSARR